MAGPEPYLADPEDLAVLLKLPADDVRLLAALRAASRRFRGQVRHPVSLVTDDTVFLDGSGQRVLRLPAAPVRRVTAVEVDGQAIEGVKVRRQAGLLLHPSGCWPEWAEVTVTYDHGHDPVPEDVAEVVVDQARVIYRTDPAIQQITTGTESVSFAATAAVGITEQWRAAVEAHRLNRGDDA
ncbi:mobile element protein [Streptomyces sp. M2CJ-2]|uniref:mobile element protein n=1 Tax=Streptomyces sp. M2CJ-2 TaxID=2803948 RepID=UPI00192850B6|nr:mobile element protein [Streptomyces sp. M2CJ-2]MBL3670806.1 mobile element protein [Streptomyces sp. M2CJ-2]